MNLSKTKQALVLHYQLTGKNDTFITEKVGITPQRKKAILANIDTKLNYK